MYTLAFFSMVFTLLSESRAWTDPYVIDLAWGATVLIFLVFVLHIAPSRSRLSDIAERLDWVREAHMTNVRMLQVHTDTSGQLCDTSSIDFLDDKRVRDLFKDSDYDQFREFSRDLREASDRIAASAKRVDLAPLHRILRILEALAQPIQRAILGQKESYVSQ